ncbi:GTP-binding protein HflX [Alkalithermobacter thermoalcaliphilus JW-YL-7 = DSM 7308]|uniref:GTPase HflX n=1 Tax=Alkalithermobacter thermoalcaliphilus JW-YL-7 = DSM 7308 TaxID=1121328 RepID=A0A150FQS0_CLOPD|nr:GTP-binding protein, HflX [[Clostridium] paradoxum JW-YL-7 = DSM 7308]SHK53139.1 GTP-binding protein HflX [[Clostridium] paradoxum JW-YL-7 = DSM 7308]
MERALLVGLDITTINKRIDNIDIDSSMDELEELAKAAGAEVVGRVVQSRQAKDPAYYIGKGKAEEIKEHCDALDVDLVIFNDELSGAQMKNLEDIIDRQIVDRTALILDIFAQRALSKEGKLQVELAQLKYRLPRLYGMGKALSRTGAGIGTRGPGEQKLEIDKRHILNRISDIKRELKEVKKNRQVQRMQRLKSDIPIVALVGYTNAGKSTLTNELIKTHKEYTKEKEVFSKDMLFATLDVTLRKALLSNNREFLVVDTVGFVSKLPHDLIEAFKATLEEVKYADLILHVVDASNRNYDIQMDTTLNVLKELDVLDKDIITVFNKVDKLDYDINAMKDEDVVFISCKTGYNIDLLLDKIETKLMKNLYKVEMIIPYTNGEIFNLLKEKTVIDKFEYIEEGIYVKVSLDDKDYGRYRDYILE